MAKTATKGVKGVAIAAKGAKFGEAAEKTLNMGRRLGSQFNKIGLEMVKAPGQTLGRELQSGKEWVSYAVKNGPAKTLRELGRQAAADGKQILNIAQGKNSYSLDKMAGLKLKIQPNHEMRGKIMHFTSDHSLAQKFPKEIKYDPELAKNFPNGIKFDKRGYPDLSPYSTKNVSIPYTGDRNQDFKLANQAAGYKETPAGMTWHHAPDGRTMQLIPTELHRAVAHGGGFGLHKAQLENIARLSEKAVSGSVTVAKIEKNEAT